MKVFDINEQVVLGLPNLHLQLLDSDAKPFALNGQLMIDGKNNTMKMKTD